MVWTPVHEATKCGSDNLLFRDRRGAASLRYRNRAKLAVLICEQKPYWIWFSRLRKNYSVACRHSLTN